MGKDPYHPDKWKTLVSEEWDIVNKSPKPEPEVYYWMNSPPPRSYSDAPARDQCKIVRLKRKEGLTRKMADNWAYGNHTVVEDRHTIVWYAWLVISDDESNTEGMRLVLK